MLKPIRRCRGEDNFVGRFCRCQCAGCFQPGLRLSPGESAIYNRADKTLQEEKTKENNTATGWRDGHFHFDYLPLQEIARELSNAFHVKIKITDEDIKDFRIRAHFTEGESLDQMLDLLQPAGNFSYSKTNDTILIHSKLN